MTLEEVFEKLVEDYTLKGTAHKATCDYMRSKYLTIDDGGFIFEDGVRPTPEWRGDAYKWNLDWWFID